MEGTTTTINLEITISTDGDRLVEKVLMTTQQGSDEPDRVAAYTNFDRWVSSDFLGFNEQSLARHLSRAILKTLRDEKR